MSAIIHSCEGEARLISHTSVVAAREIRQPELLFTRNCENTHR
jgi:hypothetical protein